MAALDFGEKVILTLYRKFYNSCYLTGGNSSDTFLTDTHILAQKMCYLLSLKGFRINGYYYTWNTYGPFSPGLQTLLRKLDREKETVDAFYCASDAGSEPISEDKVKRMIAEGSDNQLDDMISGLQIRENETNLRSWMELLGSMAFLSQTVFPHGPFSWINEELAHRKPKYQDVEMNKRAWNALYTIGLLSEGATFET